MPISRSALGSLTANDVLEHLTGNDSQSQMKLFIEKNGLKVDRLRKLGDYCATLIYERDPSVTITEPADTPAEKKANKGARKKPIV